MSHFFAHCASQKTYSHARIACNVQKRATKSDSSGHCLAGSQLRGSTIAIISAHVPGPHMWASADTGPSSSSPKQWKSDGRYKISNSFSARSPMTKSKKKNYRKRNNISACVSAMTGSVPRKMAGMTESFSYHEESNPCRRLPSTDLNH